MATIWDYHKHVDVSSPPARNSIPLHKPRNRLHYQGSIVKQLQQLKLSTTVQEGEREKTGQAVFPDRSQERRKELVAFGKHVSLW